MKTRIIKIGNSKGIVLGKALLEHYGFREAVEITMKEDCLEIRPREQTRKDWDEAFRRMHEEGDDRPLFEELPDEDLLDEWK